MSEEQALSEEERRQQEFFARAHDIGRGVVLVLNATGAPMALGIEGLSVATSLYLTNLAKRDPKAAAIIANNLALNLVGLCRELGILPEDEDANVTQQAN
jgi:hypothetical protein